MVLAIVSLSFVPVRLDFVCGEVFLNIFESDRPSYWYSPPYLLTIGFFLS